MLLVFHAPVAIIDAKVFSLALPTLSFAHGPARESRYTNLDLTLLVPAVRSKSLPNTPLVRLEMLLRLRSAEGVSGKSARLAPRRCTASLR